MIVHQYLFKNNLFIALINILFMIKCSLEGILNSISKGTNIKSKTFKSIIYSSERLRFLKDKGIQLSNLPKFLISLIMINPVKLSLTLIFFILQLSLNVASPFFSNYLIENFIDKHQKGIFLLYLGLIILGFKALKTIITVLGNYCYMSVGFDYFARIFWHILSTYTLLNHKNLGKILNIIEYDCHQVTNLCYAVWTSFFDFIEIITLLVILFYYLSNTHPFSLFVSLSILYIILQASVSFFILYYKRKYLFKKDQRLNTNLSSSAHSDILLKRQSQLKANRQYLYIKVLGKIISIGFPLLINAYIFLIADRTSFKADQYTILIIVNLIRVPISQLMLSLNLTFQVIYSCKRILSLSQSNQDSSSSQNTNLPNINSFRSQQKGVISIELIFSYCFKIISKYHIITLFFILIMVAFTKYFSFYVTKAMINRSFQTYHFIFLSLQIISPIVLYIFLIEIFQIISASIFHHYKQKLNYESLNRLCGDIVAIDLSISTNSFEIISSLISIIFSYLYSILSIDKVYLQIILAIFLMLCAFISFKSNRYVMKSRRQITRCQLQTKTLIVKGIVQQKNIIQSKIMRKSLRKIYQCKQMGILVQNYYMVIINVLLLCFSLVLILTSQLFQMSQVDKSILFITCLNIDYDMLNLFFSAVRLELSFVSFQRVLNTLDK